jgi:hypothetical protein
MEQIKWAWVDEKEVARMTSRALATLRNDRHLGRGIPYSKVGRSVRYKLEDIITFMEESRINTEAK